MIEPAGGQQDIATDPQLALAPDAWLLMVSGLRDCLIHHRVLVSSVPNHKLDSLQHLRVVADRKVEVLLSLRGNVHHTQAEDVAHVGVLNELLRGEELQNVELARRAVSLVRFERDPEHADGAALVADEKLGLLKHITTVTELQASHRAFKRALIFDLLFTGLLTSCSLLRST